MQTHEGRVALVTGGTRGIGLGIAAELARAGWRIAVNGMREESAVREPLEKLREIQPASVYCRGDVGSAAGRESILEQVRAHFGQLHLLVNNAGITSPGRKDILEATEEAFDEVMRINLYGVLFLALGAARWMIEQRDRAADFEGCIINISSVSSHTSSINRGDYCISRACVSEVTRQLAGRLFEHRINVYEIRPGVIDTDMTKGARAKYDRLFASGLTIDPRWGTPADIGRAVTVLAGGKLTYAPGTVLFVDGGLTVLQDSELHLGPR